MSDLLPVLVAALGGAAIGVERQWSGHASGPEARFAGVRTFTMLGAFAGVAGRVWLADARLVAVVLLGAAAALVVAAYVAASRRDVDATTEVAALVVLAAGLAAGLEHLRLASAVVAVTALLLVEKSRLHAWVARVDDAELRGAVAFAVMAVVVLPLLPEGPLGPWGGIRPRELWLIVLFFSGLSFAGYIARRLVGAQYGYAVSGLLGGLVSSTSVTLAYSRASRRQPEAGALLASGAVAACSILFIRVIVATLVLNPALARALVPYVLAPFLVGCVFVALGVRRSRDAEGEPEDSRNPLQLRTALEMAVLFQVVLFGITFVQGSFGRAGLLASGLLLGLTDVDALTLSMARAAGDVGVDVAAQAVVAGIASNTLLKAGLAAVIGTGAFRWRTTAALLMLTAALGVGWLWSAQ